MSAFCPIIPIADMKRGALPSALQQIAASFAVPRVHRTIFAATGWVENRCVAAGGQNAVALG